MASATSVLEYFNCFHDGIITNVQIIGATKVFRKIPWEEEPENPLEFTAMGWRGNPSLKLVIHHNNYNFPNEPWNRTIDLVFPRCESIEPHVARLVDGSVNDIVVEEKDGFLAFSVSLCDHPVHGLSNPKHKHGLCLARRGRWGER